MRSIIFSAVLVCAFALFAQTEYPHVQDNGGGYKESAGYRSYASIGQPVIGVCGDASYTNQAGYITGVSVYLNIKKKPNANLLPDRPEIGLPYPNPFNGTCQIEIFLPREDDIVFSVYTLSGQKIIERKSHRDSGAYRLTFDAGSMPSGVYLYRISIGDTQTRGKIVLVR